MNTCNLRLPAPATPLIAKTVEIFARVLAERTGMAVTTDAARPAQLELVLAPGIGSEGFCIADTAAGNLRISGNDERGLLYGVGKLLRSSHFGPGEYRPGAWRGTSVPVKPVRGMYFATHFHNFYHEAPVAEIERYVEELALWGCNTLNVWFDMHHYTGLDDPAAQAMIHRLRAVLLAANRVGIGACLCGLANEAYAGSPEALRATPVTWTGYYYVELCPQKPGALELLLNWRREMLQAFAGIDLKYFWIWPYDQGGCLCETCMPWGANGFLKAAEPVAELVREVFPRAKTVLSTWCFGYRDAREWPEFAAVMAKRPPWVDYLMVDSHGDFPEYVRQQGVPGGYPVVNFPEISMTGMYPWGGFGANPLPGRFQRLWDQCRNTVAGGFPYSEGIFEDLNKTCCLQFYWDPARPAAEIVQEYAAYEFGPAAVVQVQRAVEILEANHNHHAPEPQGGAVGRRYNLAAAKRDTAARARQLLRDTESLLPAWAARGWRWRILRIRAELDAHLTANGGLADAQTDTWLAELCRIYHADHAEYAVRPPVGS